MACVQLPRRSISKADAERQFDLLFDEYFKENVSAVTSDGDARRSFFLRQKGENRLESGSAGKLVL